MKYRWTMKELDAATDNGILLALVEERKSTLNPYSPLHERLGRMAHMLEDVVIAENVERAHDRK